MRRRALVSVGLLASLIGCKEPDSTVLVNVSISLDVAPVYSLRVAISAVQAHDIKIYPAQPSATALPSATSLVIILPRARSGRLDLAIDGVDNSGNNVAHGAGRTTIVVGGSATVSVAIAAGPSLCGDGLLTPGEACDDGNRYSFDGCDYLCLSELAHPDAAILDGAPTEATAIADGKINDMGVDIAADGLTPTDVFVTNVDAMPDAGQDLPMDSVDAPTIDRDAVAEGRRLPVDGTSDSTDALGVQPDASGLRSGQTCVAKEQCASGNCIDGVCCESPCASVCMVCNLPTAMGQCSMVTAGEDPRGDCVQDPASTCGRDGTCDGAGGCRRWPNGTECAGPSCVAGISTTARTCDGTGTCRAASTKTCAPYVCKGSTCATQCGGNGDCDQGSPTSAASYCNGGTCVRRQGIGSACTSPIQCTAGSYCNYSAGCSGAVCACPASCPYSCTSSDGYTCSC